MRGIFASWFKSRQAAIGRAILLAGFISPVSALGQSSHNISAASISVFQIDTGNTSNSVAATTTVSVNDFRIRPGSNRGDYNVQIEDSANDDVDSGVLMS